LNTRADYERELAGCRCVVHLAAATGKATAAAHERDTVHGTTELLGACRDAGVPAFLFVSSIAAAFADQRGYPYASAKSRTESAVAASGLRYTILRPTMIFGPGSPVQRSLTSLAMLPGIVLPGTGRVRVQPIAVQDVVRAIIRVLEQDRFRNETLEIGGPTTLTMEELLQRIRMARTGQRGRVLRVPLGPVQAGLRVAERIGLGALLPVTAGQFSSFRQDGVAASNALQSDLAPSLVSVDAMLATDPR
jgi:NADH dehydrogenase